MTVGFSGEINSDGMLPGFKVFAVIFLYLVEINQQKDNQRLQKICVLC